MRAVASALPRLAALVVALGVGACFDDRTLGKPCDDAHPCVVDGDQCIGGACVRGIPLDAGAATDDVPEIVVDAGGDEADAGRAMDAGPDDGGVVDGGGDDGGDVDGGRDDGGRPPWPGG